MMDADELGRIVRLYELAQHEKEISERDKKIAELEARVGKLGDTSVADPVDGVEVSGSDGGLKRGFLWKVGIGLVAAAGLAAALYVVPARLPSYFCGSSGQASVANTCEFYYNAPAIVTSGDTASVVTEDARLKQFHLQREAVRRALRMMTFELSYTFPAEPLWSTKIVYATSVDGDKAVYDPELYRYVTRAVLVPRTEQEEIKYQEGLNEVTRKVRMHYVGEHDGHRCDCGKEEEMYIHYNEDSPLWRGPNLFVKKYEKDERTKLLVRGLPEFDSALEYFKPEYHGVEDLKDLRAKAPVDCLNIELGGGVRIFPDLSDPYLRIMQKTVDRAAIAYHNNYFVFNDDSRYVTLIIPIEGFWNRVCKPVDVNGLAGWEDRETLLIEPHGEFVRIRFNYYNRPVAQWRK